jgi:arsenite methyltransferase
MLYLFSLVSLLWVCPASSFQPARTVRKAWSLSVAADPPLFVDATRKSVQQYYGEKLQTSDDLATNACCTGDAPPSNIQECIKKLHPTTVSKYYGCGLCLPSYSLTDCRILDLGCGAGRDVYIASQLAGPNGSVVGVDMTTEQLATAKEFQAYHAEKFGFQNTEFHQGYLESLDEIEGLEKGSFDVIISNCVINLCTDKAAVLRACYDLLKPGGELYFSDVYASRRVPKVLQEDELLWGECLSGALYWNDFNHLAKQSGFIDPRLVEDAPITIQNAKVANMIRNTSHGSIEFFSATYRLLKIDELEPDCEDYGQAVIYKGTIEAAESGWRLDKGHIFETGRIFPVCGNTWRMLEANPRLAPHFDFVGNWDRHYGIFEGCGGGLPYDKESSKGGASGTGASCC